MYVSTVVASGCTLTDNGKEASDSTKKVSTPLLPFEMASVRILYLLKADGALTLF